MGNNKAIGIFDSGLGGLTGVARLSELLPGEDIIYLGDTGRVPYGGKSKETIIKYAVQDVEFLLSQNIKVILVACATVSTNALQEIAPRYVTPIFGVVEPTVEMACRVSKNGRIGLIGTEASIRSRTYERMIAQKAPGAKVFSTACPLLVPLVENGRTRPGDIVVKTVVEEYLSPLRAAGVDTLILGCTHYPLLHDAISAFMGADVRLISAGAAAAEFVSRSLGERDMLSGRRSGGKHRYFVSDSTESFTRLASLFLQQDVRGEVEKVALEG